VELDYIQGKKNVVAVGFHVCPPLNSFCWMKKMIFLWT
jgi:hypothetical protein